MAERDYVVALNLIEGIGPRRLADLVERFRTAEAAWSAPLDELEARLPSTLVRRLEKVRGASAPDRIIADLARRGIHTLTYLDDGYPPGLSFLADRPPVVFLRGDPAVLRRPGVAVVGTRKPTPYGSERAHELAAGLAEAGAVVISGLAEGIDTAAHRGALSVEGGLTAAVLGSGLDLVVPERNAALAREIEHRGAVISQYAPDSIAHRGTFVRRNWVVAAMAHGVVVVEAPMRSGALITAGAAARLGRPVMAVTGPVTAPTFQGNLRLLRGGARAVGSADDVIADTGLEQVLVRLSASSGRARRPGGGTGSRAAVPKGDSALTLREMTPGESVPFAILMARTGFEAARLGAALGRLEVGGWISRQPGQCYTRL